MYIYKEQLQNDYKQYEKGVFSESHKKKKMMREFW